MLTFVTYTNSYQNLPYCLSKFRNLCHPKQFQTKTLIKLGIIFYQCLRLRVYFLTSSPRKTVDDYENDHNVKIDDDINDVVDNEADSDNKDDYWNDDVDDDNDDEKDEEDRLTSSWHDCEKGGIGWWFSGRWSFLDPIPSTD